MFRRISGIVLCGLAIAAVLVASPTESSAATCGQSGCGRYTIEYAYENGGTASFAYVSQYEWMSDATQGDKRGYLQQSGYTKMTVGDTTNKFAVTVTFCADPSGPKCRHTYSNGENGQYSWVEYSYAAPNCNTKISDEQQIWATYLQDVADVAAGSLTGAGIESPAGNQVGHIC